MACFPGYCDLLLGVQRTVPGDPSQLPSPGNGSGATPLEDLPTRPIARLPNQAREAGGSPAASNEQERAVYCLCGGLEYGTVSWFQVADYDDDMSVTLTRNWIR